MDMYPGLLFVQLFESLPRLSALAIYYRVFDLGRAGDRNWKLIVYFMAALSILWVIVSEFVNIFQCIPIKKVNMEVH